MKRRLLACLLTALFLFGMVGVVEAVMIDNINNELVLDDITGKIWYRDVAAFTSQGYSQQLDSISSLDRYYDINGDGSTDTLTWNMASHSDVLDLVSNYQLDNGINRNDFMEHFYGRREYLGNLGWEDTIEGRFAGTEDEYGIFRLQHLFSYLRNDYYESGETHVSGLTSFPIGLSVWGAWATAEVEYADAEPIPEPTTVVLLGIGLVGFAGAEVRRRRKKKVLEKS